MNNNVKMKNRDEIYRFTKLNNKTNNKHNHAKKSNIIQIIKKREINLSNFDPIKYKRALLNMQNPKKVSKNKETKKVPYTKKNVYHFFGPYNRLINGGGGFCKRLYNKNYNLDQIYELFPHNIPKYKQYTEKNDNAKELSFRNKKNEKKLNNTENILIQENDNEINHNKNNLNYNQIYNIRYNLKSNRKSSLDPKYRKLNLEDVNNSIKYLKLDKKYNNDNQLSKRETSRKNKNDKNIVYKIGYTEKKNNKLIFDGINMKKIKKINHEKKEPIIIKKLELNSTPTQTTPYEEICKTERIFIKNSIEQFSMENRGIKKFSNLKEDDSILLKFSPIKKDKSFDLKNRSDNYIISSNLIEFNYIKKIPKKEPENQKKLIIKTNELVILSSNPKTKINKKDFGNVNESNPKEINEIEINKENDDLINKNEEINKIPIVNNIINDIDNGKEIEQRRSSKTVVDKLAKYKERLKRKNEANKKKEESKKNKIKNLAFELESKMFKKEVDSEEDKKEKVPTKNEIDYNIPVVTKKKMKRKIFNGE